MYGPLANIMIALLKLAWRVTRFVPKRKPMGFFNHPGQKIAEQARKCFWLSARTLRLRQEKTDLHSHVGIVMHKQLDVLFQRLWPHQVLFDAKYLSRADEFA